MRNTKRSIFFILLFSTACMVFTICHYANTTYRFRISHESGIYDNAFELTVRSPQKGTCYYTTDGSIPSPSTENTYIYEEPIFLTPLDETTTYSFQFLYVYEDGTRSDVVARDYILDENASNRYSTKYIISVIGDEDALFSYEEGIFIRGQVFDEYLANHPDANFLDTIIPANYNSSQELPVHCAIFSTDGDCILEQNCGLKIYGNITRAKNQKSFRLIARYAYGEKNEFSYPFFAKLYSSATNTNIQNYQRLSLHNSGNDNYYAFLRSTLVGELARQAGFPDVLVSESATVYVNGRYQGVYWLQNTFDDRYFKEKYGDHSGEIAICEGALTEMDMEQAETASEVLAVSDYNDFMAWLSSADVRSTDVWETIASTFDLNNFAQYMSIEYYVNNFDWPSNNVKAYRYYPADETSYTKNSIFDGKYRYLLFDADYGLGLQFLGSFGYTASDKRLGDLLMENNESTLLFRQLMKNEVFKEQFINNTLVLLSHYFSPESMEAHLHDFNGKRYGELEFMVTQTNLMHGDLWEDEPLTMEQVWNEMNDIIHFGKKRPSIVIEELQEVLGCGNTIPISIQADATHTIYLNDMFIDSSYTGVCFENVPISIRYETPNGVRTIGYDVNGTYVEGSIIRILASEYCTSNETLQITPVYQTENVPSLAIHAYQTDGSSDYVVLENDGTLPVSLADYAISDDEHEPSKSRLPHHTLIPGEQFYIYGKGYEGTMTEPFSRVTFSWNSDEPVILSNATTEIIDIKNPPK